MDIRYAPFYVSNERSAKIKIQSQSQSVIDLFHNNFSPSG